MSENVLDLGLALKSHQVLVPQNVYIGDTAELRVSFTSEKAGELLKGAPSLELPLSNFKDELNFQEYQIEKLNLFASGPNNYTFVITFIPWKTGNIDFPQYSLLPEENISLRFEGVSISSLIKDESIGLQGQTAPLLLPGTVYKIYGILVAFVLFLLILIRLIVKRDSVAASIKRRKLNKKYKKNRKLVLKNLSKLLKNKEISDVEFAASLQGLLRNYLEVRFDFPFTKTVSSEISMKYFMVVQNPSEEKQNAIKNLEKIFLNTDVIRYAQNSTGNNKTSFLENEKQQIVDEIKKDIDLLEVQDVVLEEEKEEDSNA